MPKPPTTAQEIHGRLTLWLFVLHECQNYLKLADKAAAAATDDKRLKMIAGATAYDAYRREKPVEVAQLGEQTAFRKFMEDHPEYSGFPTWSDCLDVATNMRMLTIVTFYRIWASGDADSGKASKNTDGEIQKLRAKLVTEAFPLASEREAFERLLESVKRARDEVIAHTSAKWASIQVEGIATQLKAPSAVIDDVDMAHLARCLPVLLAKCTAIFP